MVGLEPIANVFTLTGKPNFAKNWKGRWLVIRYIGVVDLHGGLQQI
jgi:hypothetical protein